MAGEALRAEAASGEEEFDGERTRGLAVRPGPERGEPLLRRLGVGVGGETLTDAKAGTGTGDSGSDSGGGELKAGLGGSSSSSGGGDLKVGRAGISGSAAGVAWTGTGATNCGGSGTGGGFTTGSGGGGGTWGSCATRVGSTGGAGCGTGGGGGGATGEVTWAETGGTGGGTFPCALWLASQSLASVPAESLDLLMRISMGAVRLRRGCLRSVSVFFFAIVGGRTSV